MRSSPRSQTRRFVLKFAGTAVAALALVAAGRVRAMDPERPDGAGADEPHAHGGEPPLVEGVVGRVADAAGTPVAGALVLASRAGAGGGPIPELAVKTDAAGRFRWPLGPGAYRLDAVLYGVAIASGHVSVRPGQVSTTRLTAPARN